MVRWVLVIHPDVRDWLHEIRKVDRETAALIGQTRVIEMTKKTAAGWHAYNEVSELLTELDLTTDDMTRARETTDDHVRAWHLARVRTEQDRTQEDVAQAMGVTQPRVSAIERGELDTVTLSTLRAYVRALGGKLRVVADFGDQEYRLT